MNIENFIKQSIQEDCPTGDITTTSLNIKSGQIEAKLIAKDEGVFFGHDIIKHAVKQFPAMTASNTLLDGHRIKNKDIISSINGNYNDILILERTLLNFIQHLSGIASQTQRAVKLLNNPKISVCDTRKTIPGFRKLAKSAVKAGGGKNHREGLSDMILIKENHLTILEKEKRLDELAHYIHAAKTKNSIVKAEIEIETLEQLRTFDLSVFDYILLDNFKLTDIPTAVDIARSNQFTGEFECSGNITLETITQYSNLPIQRVSLGCLTHSVNAFDISLLV